MPRANRYYLLGQVWHITHRCHNRDHLFRFKKDRKEWLDWLFQTKKRYRICILNYIVTTNHIHLLLMDDDPNSNLQGFMQLLQGRIAQNYNLRKGRKGAFWEDRYHATAVESDNHLLECMAYISLNMVRAGVVRHPIDWPDSGYFEINHPHQRHHIIDFPRLLKLFNANSLDQLKDILNLKVEHKLSTQPLKREGKWTEAIAVGSLSYVENIKQQLNIRAVAREIHPSGNGFTLSEGEVPYKHLFDGKNMQIRLKKD